MASFAPRYLLNLAKMCFFYYIDIDECGSGVCSKDSQCQDYHGGFECECKVPGHFKASFNETCKRE